MNDVCLLAWKCFKKRNNFFQGGDNYLKSQNCNNFRFWWIYFARSFTSFYCVTLNKLLVNTKFLKFFVCLHSLATYLYVCTPCSQWRFGYGCDFNRSNTDDLTQMRTYVRNRSNESMFKKFASYVYLKTSVTTYGPTKFNLVIWLTERA